MTTENNASENKNTAFPDGPPWEGVYVHGVHAGIEAIREIVESLGGVNYRDTNFSLPLNRNDEFHAAAKAAGFTRVDPQWGGDGQYKLGPTNSDPRHCLNSPKL